MPNVGSNADFAIFTSSFFMSGSICTIFISELLFSAYVTQSISPIFRVVLVFADSINVPLSKEDRALSAEKAAPLSNGNSRIIIVPALLKTFILILFCKPRPDISGRGKYVDTNKY